VSGERGFSAVARPTKIDRIDAKDYAGNTGDPWTPVSQAGKALKVRDGFSYDRVQVLLFQNDYSPGITQRVFPQDPSELHFLAWAMVRGQGKTEGLHQKFLRVPGHVRRTLMNPEGKAKLGNLAKRRVECVGDIQKKILKMALWALLQGGKEKLDFKDDRPQRWIDRHDAAIDAVFFDHLWSDLDLVDAGEADRKWQRFVLDLARKQLEQAMESCPLPSVRRYRAFSAAERVFFGSARKLFPEIHVSKENLHD